MFTDNKIEIGRMLESYGIEREFGKGYLVSKIDI